MPEQTHLHVQPRPSDRHLPNFLENVLRRVHADSPPGANLSIRVPQAERSVLRIRNHRPKNCDARMAGCPSHDSSNATTLLSLPRFSIEAASSWPQRSPIETKASTPSKARCRSLEWLSPSTRQAYGFPM